MHHPRSLRRLWPALLALMCAPACAQVASPNFLSMPATFDAFAPKAADAVVSQTDAASATAAPVEGMGASIADDTLGALRGGESTSTQVVDITGGVDGNTALGTVAGDNVIDNGAFANAAGISTVIQNSGANVLIQNGMVVNVQFGAGP